MRAASFKRLLGSTAGRVGPGIGTLPKTERYQNEARNHNDNGDACQRICQGARPGVAEPRGAVTAQDDSAANQKQATFLNAPRRKQPRKPWRDLDNTGSGPGNFTVWNGHSHSREEPVRTEAVFAENNGVKTLRFQRNLDRLRPADGLSLQNILHSCFAALPNGMRLSCGATLKDSQDAILLQTTGAVSFRRLLGSAC